MAAQVSLQTVDALGAEIYVTFNVALSGNYPTGGDPLNFTSGGTLPATQDAAYIGLVAAVESSQLLQLDVWDQSGAAINGANTINIAAVKSSSNPATGGKIKAAAIQAQGTSKDAEHAASGYEPAYTGAQITGFAVFSKLL
jgi:hypothetical protein